MSPTPPPLPAGRLLDEGLVGRTAALADVRERADTSAGGVGRVLDVRVLGVEPSNAALSGPEQQALGSGAPLLAPGDTLTTEVAVRLVPGTIGG